MADNYLVHYGIMGQKWGIRRFQPYSTRGRISGKGGKEVGIAKKKSKEPTHDELLNSTNVQEVWKYKDKLSDKELRDRVNRIQTEQQLKDLLDRNDKKKQKGKSFVGNVLGRVGTMAAAGLAAYIFKEGKTVILDSYGALKPEIKAVIDYYKF